MDFRDEYINKSEAILAVTQDGCTANVVGVLYHLPPADVAPKSEVVKVLDEIEKTIRGALVLVGFSYKHNPKEIQCKKECYEDFLGYIAELKKKYTEDINHEDKD